MTKIRTYGIWYSALIPTRDLLPDHKPADVAPFARYEYSTMLGISIRVGSVSKEAVHYGWE
jgi:hypothetical protein